MSPDYGFIGVGCGVVKILQKQALTACTSIHILNHLIIIQGFAIDTGTLNKPVNC
jgi:hypothetical protein